MRYERRIVVRIRVSVNEVAKRPRRSDMVPAVKGGIRHRDSGPPGYGIRLTSRTEVHLSKGSAYHHLGCHLVSCPDPRRKLPGVKILPGTSREVRSTCNAKGALGET